MNVRTCENCGNPTTLTGTCADCLEDADEDTVDEEQVFEEALLSLIENAGDAEEIADASPEWTNLIEDKHTRVRSFKDAEILTNNKGLVVKIGRMEFQLTIVRSR